MNREFFDLYVETQLAPTLHKGDVVILDNLATHRSPKAAAILKDIGAWFVFRGKPSTGRLCNPSNSCRLTPPTLASLKSVHRTDFLTLLTHRDGIRQDQDRSSGKRSPGSFSEPPHSERPQPEHTTNSGKRSETSATSSRTKSATTSSKLQDMKPIERNPL
jgi:hypothetical protein